MVEVRTVSCLRRSRGPQKRIGVNLGVNFKVCSHQRLEISDKSVRDLIFDPISAIIDVTKERVCTQKMSMTLRLRSVGILSGKKCRRREATLLRSGI
jgi:hypothetical protein